MGRDFSERAQPAPGQPLLVSWIVAAFNCGEHIQILGLAIEDLDRLRSAALVFGIPPPIGGHDVQFTITIEVSNAHAVPPSLVGSQTQLVGGLDELAMVIVKDSERAPIAS